MKIMFTHIFEHSEVLLEHQIFLLFTIKLQSAVQKAQLASDILLICFIRGPSLWFITKVHLSCDWIPSPLRLEGCQADIVPLAFKRKDYVCSQVMNNFRKPQAT